MRDKKFGIVYLLTGAGHGARLVVSLTTLRRQYQGPITLFTTRAEAHRIGQQCAEDARLGVDHRVLEEVQLPTKKVQIPSGNTTYLTKIEALEQSPYTSTLMLDADTVVVRDISKLIKTTTKSPLTVTKFCRWKTTHKNFERMMHDWNRLLMQSYGRRRWKKLVEQTTVRPQPIINAGVIGVARDAPIFAEWKQLAHFGRDRFIPDEVALQLLLPKYSHKMLSTKYNSTPLAIPDNPKTRIWHFIASTHLRHRLSREIWLPHYKKCRKKNIAGLAKWSRVKKQAKGRSAAPQLPACPHCGGDDHHFQW